MLDEHPELISSRDAVGETALCYLAIEDCADGVEFLISRGADVNAPTDFGETPLIEAAGLGYDDMVDLLLKHGARTELATNNGETALHYAARTGRESVVRRLLTAGADIEARDSINNTALHEAAGWGHFGTVRILLDAGADVLAKGLWDDHPLHEACGAGNLEIANLLIERGAEVNAWCDIGPPLFNLDKAGMDFVRFMLSKGAILEGVDSQGRTMLHCVAYHGLQDAVEFLLDRGFDPLIKDEHGHSAIDEANRGGHPETADSIRKRIR